MSRITGEPYRDRGATSSGQRVPPLSRSVLDRAAHHRRDPQWLADAWERAFVLVIGSDGKAAVHHGDLVLLPPDQAPAGDRFFLGVHGDQPYFAVAVADGLPGDTVHLWQVGELLSDLEAGLFTEAIALMQWHRDHIYSPKTGEKTEISDGGWIRRGPDGDMHFPRTDVAMIVLVHDGVPGPQGRALLGSNVLWKNTARPRYSTLAGFVEPGESAEAAVVREVREEVGVELADVTYVGSQPWPFPRSLMLGFLAMADPTAPVVTDPDEIIHARWFTREEIAAAIADPDSAPFQLPMGAAISMFLMRRWLVPDAAPATSPAAD
jgi:NAD+ diphosphatase